MENPNKSIFFVLIFLIIFIINNLQAKNNNWIRVYETGAETYDSFRNLHCADSLYCMFMNYYGGNNNSTIVKTTDGGKNWYGIGDSLYLSNPSFYNTLHDISYPTAKLVIGVGDSGLVIRSTDKGESWQKFTLDKNKSLNFLTCSN